MNEFFRIGYFNGWLVVAYVLLVGVFLYGVLRPRVAIGDEIEVRVLKFDKEKTRVSLGLKQLDDDPWRDINRRYPESTRIFGKVTNIADYGCFVEIEEGIQVLSRSSFFKVREMNCSRQHHL